MAKMKKPIIPKSSVKIPYKKRVKPKTSNLKPVPITAKE